MAVASRLLAGIVHLRLINDFRYELRQNYGELGPYNWSV